MTYLDIIIITSSISAGITLLCLKEKICPTKML